MFVSYRLPAYSVASKAIRVLMTIVLSSSFLSLPRSYAQQTSKVYPSTAGEPLSGRFKVTVGGEASPVYVAKVGTPTNFTNEDESLGQASFTSFDIDGKVEVVVTYAQAVTKAKVLPTSAGITPTISGDKVMFWLTQPGQFTVDVNGDWSNSLQIFANAFETDVPSPKDPNVLYFKQGVYRLGAFEVPAGTTIYLAPGAFLYAKANVRGPLITLQGDNITLRGRGVIDGSLQPKGGGNLIYVYGKKNIQVEGVTLRDSSAWNFNMSRSQNVQVANMKVFGWRLNSDGIDIDGSQGVTVTGSFFRTYDDQIVIKTSNTKGISASNIQVSNCVIWNQVARGLSVGTEMNALAQNISFTDSDIIHDKGRDALLVVENSGPALIQNVAWSNIRIEEAQRLIAVSILNLTPGQAFEPGSVANLTFNGISAPIPERAGPNVSFVGFNVSNDISGVTMKNVTVGGQPINLGDVSQNTYVSGVVVGP
jgi:Glycosyl hydrolases family 28